MERRANRGGRDTLLCPNRECRCKSSPLDEVESCVLEALRRWLSGYRPERDPGRSGTEANVSAYMEAETARLESALAALRKQRGCICDLMERGVYSEEVYKERGLVLDERINRTAEALEKARIRFCAQQALSESLPDVPRLENIVDQYPLLPSAEDKNRFFKTVLSRVDYFKTSGGRWGRSDLSLSVFPSIRST